MVSINGCLYTASHNNNSGFWRACPLTDPAQAIVALVSAVEHLNIQHGILNSLDAKLDAAVNALDDVNENNNVAAVNSLQAFINAVQTQDGSKIETEDAAALIADAQLIIDLLENAP